VYISQPWAGFQQTTEITVERQGFIIKTIHFPWPFYVADRRQSLMIYDP